MENNHEISVTPLTDDEIKEFNEQVKHAKVLPVRDALKDMLRVIKLTAVYFYHHMSETKGIDMAFSVDELINDAITNVDEMDDTELMKIKEHSNLVSDAYQLVEVYLPDELIYGPQTTCVNPYGNLSSNINPRVAYLKKVFDIYQLLCTPTVNYKGSDIGYNTTIAFKEALEDYPGGKVISRTIFPDNTIYILPHHEIKPQQVLCFSLEATISGWVDDNLDDEKRAFYDFATKHLQDIIDYMDLLNLSCAISPEQTHELCTFFYRWFLKEQTSK